MDRKRLSAYAFWLLFLCWIPAEESVGMDICGHDAMATVEITRGVEGVGIFAVTLAASAESQRRGLMHCPSLNPGTGMLFTYPDARRRVFWMKNTAIELAIIFISAEGRIAAIERGEPGSLNRIHSPAAIQSVLEINYRESRRLAVGDRVRLGGFVKSPTSALRFIPRHCGVP